jgi:hypothetical protein
MLTPSVNHAKTVIARKVVTDAPNVLKILFTIQKRAHAFNVLMVHIALMEVLLQIGWMFAKPKGSAMIMRSQSYIQILVKKMLMITVFINTLATTLITLIQIFVLLILNWIHQQNTKLLVPYVKQVTSKMHLIRIK